MSKWDGANPVLIRVCQGVVKFPAWYWIKTNSVTLPAERKCILLMLSLSFSVDCGEDLVCNLLLAAFGFIVLISELLRVGGSPHICLGETEKLPFRLVLCIPLETTMYFHLCPPNRAVQMDKVDSFGGGSPLPPCACPATQLQMGIAEDYDAKIGQWGCCCSLPPQLLTWSCY